MTNMNLQDLPVDVLQIVKSFIPIRLWCLLSREKYIIHHARFVTSQISNLESYIRGMVRNDHWFVFEQLMRERCERWIRMKGYIYDNHKFHTYMEFIEYYCRKMEACKCLSVIDEILLLKGISKNQFKKNRIKHITYD